MKFLINNIVGQLRDIHGGKNWMGPNFNQKLAHITEDSAFVRPIANLHSVAEIISHLTTWRKEAILKIRTGRGSITDDDGENWLSNNKLKEMGWDAILSSHRDTLNELIALLETKDDGFLKEKYYDTDFGDYFEYKFVVHGMLHHDIYHLGQLGIIVKFLNGNTGRPIE